MKGFLGTLSQIANPPSVVALMNEGVKLALKKTRPHAITSSLSRRRERGSLCAGLAPTISGSPRM